jgi:hypothetical protein
MYVCTCVQQKQVTKTSTHARACTRTHVSHIYSNLHTAGGSYFALNFGSGVAQAAVAAAAAAANIGGNADEEDIGANLGGGRQGMGVLFGAQQVL